LCTKHSCLAHMLYAVHISLSKSYSKSLEDGWASKSYPNI